MGASFLASPSSTFQDTTFWGGNEQEDFDRLCTCSVLGAKGLFGAYGACRCWGCGLSLGDEGGDLLGQQKLVVWVLREVIGQAPEDLRGGFVEGEADLLCAGGAGGRYRDPTVLPGDPLASLDAEALAQGRGGQERLAGLVSADRKTQATEGIACGYRMADVLGLEEGFDQSSTSQTHLNRDGLAQKCLVVGAREAMSALLHVATLAGFAMLARVRMLPLHEGILGGGVGGVGGGGEGLGEVELVAACAVLGTFELWFVADRVGLYGGFGGRASRQEHPVTQVAGCTIDALLGERHPSPYTMGGSAFSTLIHLASVRRCGA